jgi:hypothetical protein
VLLEDSQSLEELLWVGPRCIACVGAAAVQLHSWQAEEWVQGVFNL